MYVSAAITRRRVSLAATIVLTAFAAGGTLLTGCGSGSGTLTAVPVASPTPGSYAGRSYSAGALTVNTTRTAALNLTVDSDGTTFSGNLLLGQPGSTTIIGTIPVAGSLDPSSGAFTVHGSGTVSGSTLSISASGTLPGGSATTGGHFTLVVGANTVDVAFNGIATTTTPTGSPSPSPSGSPTPTATPTATPTPTPTPTPTGNASLSGYFASSGATLTYSQTTTTTTPSFTGGAPSTTTTNSTYTQSGINPFSARRPGNSTTAQVTTASGTFTVTKQEELDDNGHVIGYDYFTQTGTDYSQYGTDSVDTAGHVTEQMRYSPAISFPLNLTPGQHHSETVQITNTTFDLTNNTSSSQTYSETFTLTFVDIESVTVTAGTFANCAQIKFEISANIPTSGDDPASTFSGSFTNFIAPNLGMVKSSSDFRTATSFTIPGSSSPTNIEFITQTAAQLTSFTRSLHR